MTYQIKFNVIWWHKLDKTMLNLSSENETAIKISHKSIENQLKTEQIKLYLKKLNYHKVWSIKLKLVK